MKKLINILLVLPLLILALSCRNDDIPEDIHEHEEIEKLVVELINKNNPSDIQKIQYIGGISDKTIELEEGAIYEVSLDFQTRHDDHYHSSNEELLEEREEHYITFEFANAEVAVKRTNAAEARADGNRLGLSTEWKVNSVTGAAKTNIKLVHLPVTIQEAYPSTENQQGKTTGGETDVNAFLNMVKK